MPHHIFELPFFSVVYPQKAVSRKPFLPLSEDWGRLVTSSVTARASESALAATAVAEASFAISFLFVIFG